MKNFEIFNDNSKLYDKMLKDISEAKEYIYLETYIFCNDNIGRKFRDAIEKKARENIDVKILLDDFGSPINNKFFQDLISLGGNVKFFKKFKFCLKIIDKNNHRNHRKLLIIDDKIAYIGSSNISEKTLDWREINIRIESGIAKLFRRAFLKNFSISNKHIFRKKMHIAPLKYNGLEIIRDAPSIKFRKIRNKKIKLIKKAKKQILIETPYFLPDRKLRKALKKAAKKGVEVKIILPKKSDVKIIDILCAKYFGALHKNGINIYFYGPKILHSKLMIVDGENFSVGSANLDFRSMLFQFEINLFGKNKAMADELKNHFNQTLAESKLFDYKKWEKRSIISKILERLLMLIRRLL